MISLVINLDTRPGVLAECSTVGEFTSDDLYGCRSADFLTHGIENKQAFFQGYDLETILVLDEREPIPDEIRAVLNEWLSTGKIQKLVIQTFDHARYRWNCMLYKISLEFATQKYVVHADQDVTIFRRPDCDIVAQYLRWLDQGFKYVCQPHNGGDMMWHASTRFFICRRETLDFTEIERCMDQNYVNRNYGPQWWCPCLEHILGVISGPGKVLYPPLQPDDYLIWSWVKYHRGTLPKLNAMPYEEVRDYALKCGIHGPMDLIGTPII